MFYKLTYVMLTPQGVASRGWHPSLCWKYIVVVCVLCCEIMFKVC